MRISLAFAWIAVTGCVAPPNPAPNPASATVNVDSQRASVVLRALFESHWEREQRENPVAASLRGDRRFNRQWPDRSLAGLAASHRADREELARADAIDTQTLNRDEQIHLRVFKLMLRNRIENYRLGNHLMPVNHREGVQALNGTADYLRLETEQDVRDWLARLSTVDRVVEQTIEVLREGIAQGRTQPRIVMERVPKQIAAQVVSDPRESPFFSAIPDAYGEEGARIIETVVVPAYRRFSTFFNDVYLPACRNTIAATALPAGDKVYAFAVRRHTTTQLTADEVHTIGLREVERIRREMEAVRQEVDFAGDLAAFMEFLRTDPQFFYPSSEELLAGYEAMAARLTPKLPELFGRLPRARFEVRAIPDTIAPDTTTAYYGPPALDGSRPGYYWVNLYEPASRPKWEMAALSVHEAVPGHHLQIAIAQELEGVPQFRREYWVTAFGEGWALYSERLGYELGLYEDPYSRFGQLTYDMWRAVRLVVDTGMHAKGWSRDRAIRYFMTHAPKSELDIVNEIDRYIAWPGQALGYKIGQLEILKLRAEAERVLGERFDLRAFHDVVLGSGTIPLEILAANVRGWISSHE
ncbi:MAG: DUF885 domain-containing protein [Myxococcota bacterium]